MGKVMDEQKITTYQKTILFHFASVESKLFRNRFLLVFIAGLILALSASIGTLWYNNGLIPSLESGTVLVVSVLIMMYLIQINRYLTAASVFLIELHTRLFMFMRIFKQFDSSDENVDFKTILETEMDLLESEIKLRFKHTL